MKCAYKNFFLLPFLFLLASCFSKEQKPERLLPPEPVLIKGDEIIRKKAVLEAREASKKESELSKEADSQIDQVSQDSESGKEEFPPPLQTEEEAQQPIPAWAKAKGDGVYKLGKPYKVNGVWYFPAENPRYDEIGFASRYPKSFQGQRTANGEIYSRDLLTASHKTLPLPSVVQVTNLFNNKSIIVRINDRGPFVNDRLIDLSEKAAVLLEFPEEGNAKVRVEILNQESKTATSALQGAKTAVLPTHAYPPSIAKETEISSPLEKPENFVAVEPSVTSEETNSENLFDSEMVALQEEKVSPLSPAEETLAPLEQITAPAPVSEKPINPPASVPEKAYYVQAGVFANPENARNLSEKLHAVGPVKSTPVAMNGRLLHRVRVGPFPSIAEANLALARVRGHDLPDARIITS